MTGEDVPDLTPKETGSMEVSPVCPECPMIDAFEQKRQEAVTAAWAGVVIAILGVLTWNTFGFAACGVAAIVFGLYARPFAPKEANGAFAAGGLVLGVLAVRLAGLL